MLARLLAPAVAAVSVATACGPFHAVTVRHVAVHRLLHPLLFPRFRQRFTVARTPRLQLPSPDEIVPPGIEAVPEPSEPPMAEPMQFPHGFALTVPIGGARPAVPDSIKRFVEVGQALAACWMPPLGAWSAITLRVSFKRDGSVNGMPRVPFVDAPGAERQADLRRSLLASLQACVPLPFSPSLGFAVAGEIFAVRFTNKDSR